MLGIILALVAVSPVWADIEQDKRDCNGLRPLSSQAIIGACSRWLQSGRIGKANKLYAYNERGNIYAALKQYRSAIQDYTRAIRLNPRYGVAYNNRGLAYGGLLQHRRAISDFSQAIRLNPRSPFAYDNRGFSYHELKQYRLAIADHS